MHKNRPVESLLNLPTPMNISIWWNMGSILGLILGLQLLTGILLSMHYSPQLEMAFSSIIHIIRDVPGGWFLRLLHANGASFFFLFMYAHIGRGLYYQSYIIHPRVWMVGVTIFLASMATAFLGYVLPWGQMSFWGATVITNLLSAVPYFGANMVEWVWGGFSVGHATLNRFFSLHFLLPFIISGLALLHIIFLHDKGSSNPLGNLFHLSKKPFHPYFTIKDTVGFLMVISSILFVTFFIPSLLLDPENYINANPMVTPTHIQPEWYFLYAYAILRSIPSKLGGVVALLMSILILYFMPLSSFRKSTPVSMNLMYQMFFWLLVVIFVILTWLGACEIEEPYLSLAGPLTLLYFLMFFLLGITNNLHYNLMKIEYFT